jgi:hypothetical protein
VLLNVAGLIISMFSVAVTYNLYRKYRLARTLGFLWTAAMIFLWNIAHILYDVIPGDAYDTARIAYVLAQVAGMFLILGVVFSFSVLRNESLSINTVFYSLILSFFLALLLARPDFMDIVYSVENESWNSEPQNGVVWGLYSLFILIFLALELYLPYIRFASGATGDSRKYTYILLVLSLIGPLANALLGLILSLGLPAVSRYLIANLAFLGIFYIYLEQPFVGIQDSVEVKQIMISNNAGMPVLTSADLGDAALQAGALHGINSILDEITGPGSNFVSEAEEATRKIELADERFYIIRIRDLVCIFQYSNHSGVCIAKFTSLGRILRDISDEDPTPIKTFISFYQDYFPDQSDLIGENMMTSAPLKGF